MQGKTGADGRQVKLTRTDETREVREEHKWTRTGLKVNSNLKGTET